MSAGAFKEIPQDKKDIAEYLHRKRFSRPVTEPAG
jgi:hypothetical protein